MKGTPGGSLEASKGVGESVGVGVGGVVGVEVPLDTGFYGHINHHTHIRQYIVNSQRSACAVPRQPPFRSQFIQRGLPWGAG